MMELQQFTLNTEREGFYNITAKVQETVTKSGIHDGLCIVYCPHTTAGITINENADPDVVTDMLLGLRKAFPDRPEFRHSEGNSGAHLKASSVGSSVTVIVSDGRLLLGTWQGIYFCEFDGPRTRKCIVRVSE
jgi:secondary thiamine-phosphate synthase enzyme